MYLSRVLNLHTIVAPCHQGWQSLLIYKTKKKFSAVSNRHLLIVQLNKTKGLFLILQLIHVTIIEDFERFQYFNFEISFPKNENFFQKKLKGYFLVGSNTIVNATLPYKTV